MLHALGVFFSSIATLACEQPTTSNKSGLSSWNQLIGAMLQICVAPEKRGTTGNYAARLDRSWMCNYYLRHEFLWPRPPKCLKQARKYIGFSRLVGKGTASCVRTLDEVLQVVENRHQARFDNQQSRYVSVGEAKKATMAEFMQPH